MIVYMSGTGNSRYAAECLAHRLGDALLDAGRRIKEGNSEGLFSQTPWVFVAPTYAWQMPHVFEDYLKAVEFSGSREAYFVLTCGSEIGDAGSYADALCREKGLTYRGICEVVMPENYIARYDVPPADECAALMERARETLTAAAEMIAAGKALPEKTVTIKDRKLSGIVNKTFYRMFVKAKDFFVTDACTGCGYCVDACLLNNIRLKDGKPVWGENCTHCMACICGCPTEAVEYGKISRGKVRYQCPRYEEK